MSVEENNKEPSLQEELEKNTATNNEVEEAEKVEVKEELDELTVAQNKVQDLEDQILRIRAEMENSRKAWMKDAEKRTNIAVKNMAFEFLKVMDVFSQGIAAAENATDIQGVLSGMKMVDTMFNSALTEIGIKEIEVKEGDAFDPNFHQPLSRVESSDHPENTVLNIITKGYSLKGMLVKPAFVNVSCLPQEKNDESDSESSESAEKAEAE